jgi:hypothetical protein
MSAEDSGGAIAIPAMTMAKEPQTLNTYDKSPSCFESATCEFKSSAREAT